MRRNYLILYIIALFTLSACQSKTLIFNGESENWSATVTVTQTEDKQEQGFMLRYKGEDIKSVEGSEIGYKIEDNTGSSSGAQPLKSNGAIESEGTSACSGCAFVTEDTEMKFTVEWGDHTEIILLHASDK